MCESTPDSSQNPVTQHAEGDEIEVVKPSTPSGNAYVLAIHIDGQNWFVLIEICLSFIQLVEVVK